LFLSSPFCARGVGSSIITADGNARSPDDPRMFGPPFSPSLAFGVGSRATASSRFLRPDAILAVAVAVDG
jgi:hypothetical protein